MTGRQSGARALAVIAICTGIPPALQAASSCTAAAAPASMRVEGAAELAGDIVLTCTGGIPTAAGAAVPQGSVTVFLNTAVTSRTFNSSTAAEALLLVDEPGSASNPRQRRCGSTNGCALTGAGPAGVRYDGSNGHPNIFQGIAGSSSVTFNGIPFDAAPPGSSRTLRIANVRADAGAIAAGNQVIASIGVSASLGLAIVNPVLTTGFAQPGLSFSLRNGADASLPLGPAGVLMQTGNTPRSAAPSAWLRLAPAFPTAFRTRTSAAFAGADTSPPPAAQNIPGAAPNTESGFTIAVSGGTAGLATSGTRLRAAFNNVPAGVRIWVGLINQGGSSAAMARMVRSADGGFDPVDRTDTFGSVAVAEIPLAGGSGSAVWEILAAGNQNYDIPVWFAGASAVAGTGTVAASLAPARADTNSGVPRFTGAAAVLNLLTVAPGATLTANPGSLLFRASPGVIPLPQTAALTVTGAAGSMAFFSSTATDRGGSWLRATPAGDTAFGCTVSIDAAALAPGFYTGTVVLQLASAVVGTVAIPVSLVVMPPPSTASAGQIFAHIADGGSWKTSINLINTDAAPANFTLRFWDANGNPWRVPLGPDGVQTQISGTLAAGGSRTLQTDGLAAALSVGWAELVSSGSIAGTAIFGEQESGLPDSEAAVPSTPLRTRRFLLPFDNSAGTGTGVAFANPDPAQTAVVSATYRDPFGQTTFTGGPIYVPPRGHVSFVLPAAAGVEGVAEFTSTSGIAGLGIRGHGRLFTSLETLSRVPAGDKTITHLADGAGWKTSIILVNSGAEPAPFTLRFWNDRGAALTLGLGPDGRHSSISGTIAPGGSRTIRTDGAGSALNPGWAELQTAGRVGGTAIFAAKIAGQPDAEAAVPIAGGGARRFVLPVDGSAGFATGVAFGNPAVATTVTVAFRTEAGVPVAAPTTFSVPSHGHFSAVLPVNLRGVAEVTSGTAIFALGIRGHNQAFTSVRTLLVAPALADVVSSVGSITAGDDAAPLAPLTSDWVPLASGDFDTPAPSTFAAARTYGSGRVAAAGDEGLLVKAHLLDNAAFAANLLAWLDSAGRRSVVWTSGHGELTTTPGSALAAALDAHGFTTARLRQTIDAAALSEVSVLIVGNAQTDFTAAEIQALDDFVAAGGGLLLLGNAASWLSTHGGSGPNAYPMTTLAQPFGLAFPAGVIRDPDPQDQLAGATIFRTFYPNARQ